jgi:hypothetical protein
MTTLCEIMNKYGSDKGNGWHNYTITYHELFENKRNEKLNIFELGLGTNNTSIPNNMGVNGKPGASLRGWKEYFWNSNIYGADIDRSILFNEERIKTFYCDVASEEEIKKMWQNESLKNLMFDIIIDDGLHLFDANINFLKCSIHKLNDGGIYVCEDLLFNTVNSFNNIINTLRTEYPNMTFEIKIIPSNINHLDNNLLIVKKNGSK